MPCIHLFVLFSFTLVIHTISEQVCDTGYCDCTPSPHPSWTKINCTVPYNQDFDILSNYLPSSTTYLEVGGYITLTLSENALSALEDIRHLRVSGAKSVLIRKFTAVNLHIVNLFLEIEDCELLRIEEKAFFNIKGPLMVTIRNCAQVYLEGEAFSWLLSMNIVNVQKLQLSAGAFVLDPTAANVGEHGPGLKITLKNSTIGEFPEQTFGSSAAAIELENVNVHAIRSGAFSANTYNVINATNSSFHLIEGQSFAQKSLIKNMYMDGCNVHQFASDALLSGTAQLKIIKSRFDTIESGAINTTVAKVTIMDSRLKNFQEKGFILSSWNSLQIQGNYFGVLVSNAIDAPSTSVHELIFVDNNIVAVNKDSLRFIGRTLAKYPATVTYRRNYYGQRCHCNFTLFLSKALAADSGEPFENESYCTVEEILARCFNVPEQNILLRKFLNNLCHDKETVECEQFKTINEDGVATEIKNTRFPEENENVLSDRDKKVIGIVIVTILGCLIIVMFISLVRWMRRKGYCIKLKNLLHLSNCDFCDTLCACSSGSGLDNARSISQLSVNEYSERHRLNETIIRDDIVQETALPELFIEENVAMDDKTTQTLPEELTKELLENLKEKLDDPENYAEAREMIEHLYELIKVEESCNSNVNTLRNVDENIYELPFQNTTPRIGKNKKTMISQGTKVPSLEKLLPLSPYNRPTALVHEYFEPRDLAIHLYAEVTNDKDKKSFLSAVPDILAEQPVPRGPYLRAVHHKLNVGVSNNSVPDKQFIGNNHNLNSSLEFKNLNQSNSLSKMINRPLPEKPATADPGEGTSFTHI